MDTVLSYDYTESTQVKTTLVDERGPSLVAFDIISRLGASPGCLSPGRFILRRPNLAIERPA